MIGVDSPKLQKPKEHCNLEAQKREALQRDKKGYGQSVIGESGHKRFVREES